MKKVILLLAICAVSACNQKNEEAGATVDTVMVDTPIVVVDSALNVVDSVQTSDSAEVQ